MAAEERDNTEQEDEGAIEEDFVNVDEWEDYTNKHISSDDEDSLIVSFQFTQGI